MRSATDVFGIWNRFLMIELWKAIPTSTSSEILRKIIINLEFGRILKSDSLFRETCGSEGMIVCKSLEKEK
jgi:hypothetical protein